MQMTPQATRTTSVDAADWSLGEVLWRDTDSGIEGRTVIRTPKCTIGSHPDSTICLPEPAALCHATLTFGKRFTLLKAPYPTQIAGRFVREWLIDEPTELNIGSWRIVVVPARCSKSLASVMRPENFLDGRSDRVTPAAAVRTVVQPRAAGSQSIDSELAHNAIERLGQIEEQSETKIKAIEASLESLRQSLELVQANVAQNSNELVARYQSEFQNLSLQWATEVQQQIQSQLELRDTAWTQSLQSNLSHLESQMSSLGRQMESLSSGVSEKLESQLAKLDTGKEDDSPRWFESLHQVETRLADISERVDRLTSTTDDNAQRLDAIASITQENYEYVLGQIQAFQHPTESAWNGVTYPQIDTAQINTAQQDAFQHEAYQQDAYQPPQQDLSAWSYEQAPDSYPTGASDLNWNVPSYADPVYDEASAPPEIEYPVVSEQAQEEPVSQEPFDAYKQNESFLPLSSYTSVDEPVAPSYSTHEHSEEAGISEEENDPDLNMDDLSERLRRLIADASQPSDSQPADEVPLFPNSVLAHYDTQAEQTDAPEVEQEASYSEWRPSSNLVEESMDQEVSSSSGFSPVRLPWNVTPPEDDYPREEAQASLDADAILAKYGSSGQSEILDEEPVYSAEAILDHPLSLNSSSSAEGEEETVEDESIEAYMQKLLQRVKTGPELGPELPKEMSKQSQRSRMEILTGNARESASMLEDSPVSTTRRMMSPAEFTPRNTAPEKKNDLDALRELANMNARRAISHSDKKRSNSAILFKVSIVSLAIACAAIIFALNGTQRNPPFAGMIAALIVAGLWGYDCLQHFLRLAKAPSKPNASTTTDSASVPTAAIAKD
ncbi:hypothetical protein SH501x_002881 [Pirellulaceae bacterium SH501]